MLPDNTRLSKRSPSAPSSQTLSPNCPLTPKPCILDYISAVDGLYTTNFSAMESSTIVLTFDVSWNYFQHK